MLDPPRITPASNEQLAEVFSLVYCRLSQADHDSRVKSLVNDARRGILSTEGVFEARREGRLVGAIFSQVQPGRTAVGSPPRVVADEPDDTLGSLFDAMLAFFAENQTQVAHVLLESEAHQDDRLLRANGFEPLADLLYLVSAEGDLPQSRPQGPLEGGPLEFLPYDAAIHDRLAAMVQATYEQSLDCPALNGVRAIDDILAGYQASGVFRPDLWFLIRHESRDVGCLLLADHPQHGNCELAYMGLHPNWRGRGWGAHITRFGQWVTRRLGRSRLILAVDSANRPARDMYTTAGFVGWDRRIVYWRVLD